MATILSVQCDIVGTLDGTPKLDSGIRTQQLKKIFNHFKQIQQLNSYDQLLFSLNTSEEFSFLKSYYKEIELLLKQYQLTSGKQFYDQGWLENGINYATNSTSKCDKIISYVEELKRQYEKVDVLYLEDCPFHVELLVACLEETCSVQAIVPSSSMVNEAGPIIYHKDPHLFGLQKGLQELLERIEESKSNSSSKQKRLIPI